MRLVALALLFFVPACALERAPIFARPRGDGGPADVHMSGLDAPRGEDTPEGDDVPPDEDAPSCGSACPMGTVCGGSMCFCEEMACGAFGECNGAACTPCGGRDEMCCSSGCRDGLVCRTTMGNLCRDAPTCGSPGLPCCAENTCEGAATCSGGTCRAPCGGEGQECCPTDRCTAPFTWCRIVDFGGRRACRSCGGRYESCCPGGVCEPGMRCYGTAVGPRCG